MAILEIWSREGRELFELQHEKYTIGRTTDNDIVLDWDRAVSQTHALLERIGKRWLVRDMTSTNGTFVNGERIVAPRMLRDEDEVHLGHSRVRFCDRELSVIASTERTGPAPKLTGTEYKVLVELCRPLISATAFSMPATVRDIASRLCVGEPAVKQHLSHMYDKFEIVEDDGTNGPRRARLANAALESGAVKVGDLHEPT